LPPKKAVSDQLSAISYAARAEGGSLIAENWF
jgi:hypothetical protein